ncbi:hypothetical protein HELRODRAFT_163771 [Helobdella robusta]|uniref:Uncharacterized protein n=1 Tax=Helobdella robusta TaxID=6412 RepID=T1EUG2_HELRO|nr:hypothetical protein HELRODRAFT_163771 [Helobdella robusta]ESN96675.1 hypothetical protein HELRODRAFT_163771 [Helobdella robusta]
MQRADEAKDGHDLMSLATITKDSILLTWRFLDDVALYYFYEKSLLKDEYISLEKKREETDINLLFQSSLNDSLTFNRTLDSNDSYAGEVDNNLFTKQPQKIFGYNELQDYVEATRETQTLTPASLKLKSYHLTYQASGSNRMLKSPHIQPPHRSFFMNNLHENTNYNICLFADIETFLDNQQDNATSSTLLTVATKPTDYVNFNAPQHFLKRKDTFVHKTKRKKKQIQQHFLPQSHILTNISSIATDDNLVQHHHTQLHDHTTIQHRHEHQERHIRSHTSPSPKHRTSTQFLETSTTLLPSLLKSSNLYRTTNRLQWTGKQLTVGITCIQASTQTGSFVVTVGSTLGAFLAFAIVISLVYLAKRQNRPQKNLTGSRGMSALGNEMALEKALLSIGDSVLFPFYNQKFVRDVCELEGDESDLKPNEDENSAVGEVYYLVCGENGEIIMGDEDGNPIFDVAEGSGGRQQYYFVSDDVIEEGNECDDVVDYEGGGGVVDVVFEEAADQDGEGLVSQLSVVSDKEIKPDEIVINVDSFDNEGADGKTMMENFYRVKF